MRPYDVSELTLTPEQVAKVRVIRSPFAEKMREQFLARIRNGEIKLRGGE